MADNEYAIWRAIGILTQRVRDLEQPTPASEPPSYGHPYSDSCPCPACLRMRSRAEPPKAWPIEYGAIGAAIDKLDREGHLEKPEASQPLPAEVEGAIRACWGDLQRAFSDSSVPGMEKAWREFNQSLVSLWPKAGQVPSVTVTQLVAWAEQEYPDLYNHGREIPGDFFTRLVGYLMGQPSPLPPQSELDKCAADELRRIEAKAKGVQPSPVTAEKLAKWLKKYDKETEEQVVVHYSAMAEALLQAFPTLGQGRLTREQIMDKLTEEFSGHYSLGYCERIAADLLALQPKVSKEQWQKLLNHCHDNHNVSLWAIKAWLMAEFDAEVAE